MKTGNGFLSVWEHEDIVKRLSSDPVFPKHFSAVMLDAHYLRSSSLNRWERDYTWLKKSQLDVIVDFSRFVFGFRRIGFYPQRKLVYTNGMAYATDVFAKMKNAKRNKAVFVLERNKFKDLKDLDEGVAGFCQLAARARVELYLRPSKGKGNKQIEALIAHLQKTRKK